MRRVQPDRVASLRRINKIVNWGVHSPFRTGPGQVVLNKPEAVAIARDKLATFRKLKEHGVPHVEFFETQQEAEAGRGNKTIFARLTTCGSAGAGIQIIPPRAGLPAAPLYTAYFPKTDEYRVHVFGGRSILVQQKRRKEDGGADRTEHQKKIRSHENGWAFCVNRINGTPAQLQALDRHAIAAVRACGLDFGAVDLLLKDNDVRVCEVNTMPGLEGETTVSAYVGAIKAME